MAPAPAWPCSAVSRCSSVDLAEHIVQHRLVLTVFTNGLLLKDETIAARLGALCEKGAQVRVSLAGATAQVCDRVSGAPRFESVIEGIRTLARFGPPPSIDLMLLPDQIDDATDGELQGVRLDGLEHELTDSLVDIDTEHALAWRVGHGRASVAAAVLGNQAVAVAVVAHGHASSAPTAQHPALKQGGAFTRRPMAPVASVGLCRLCERGLDELELVPRDVARMGFAHQRGPLVPGQWGGGDGPVWCAPRAPTAVDVGTRVARIMQDDVDSSLDVQGSP
jgi:hypothetical protein